MQRLFFGAHVCAPWPELFPSGRVIGETMRHITLAFLGACSFSKLQEQLPNIPPPSFTVGLGGTASRVVFLPPDEQRVAALELQWWENPQSLIHYQKNLIDWLTSLGYAFHDQHSFYPHITIARSPFEKEDWKNLVLPIPFYITGIHLYESMGNLNYQSRWHHPLKPPFVELEHTADIAFEIRGETMEQLHRHAELALCFIFPPLAAYTAPIPSQSLDEIIIELNNMIATADTEIGCPFKAVSFHGKIHQSNHLFCWEMIVDV